MRYQKKKEVGGRFGLVYIGLAHTLYMYTMYAHFMYFYNIKNYYIIPFMNLCWEVNFTFNKIQGLLILLNWLSTCFDNFWWNIS